MDNDDKKVDENISGTDKTTMHNAGVDVSEDPKEIVDIDSSPVAKDDVELKSTGITFVDDKPKTPDINKEDLSSLAEKAKKDAEKALETTDDLEKEFQKTIGDSPASPEPVKKESLGDQISGLTAMLGKIRERLGFKKAEVKEDLENLKKVKEDISKDIENIKELEESEDKIEDQLKKVEKIQEEISSIEDEVEKELKS